MKSRRTVFLLFSLFVCGQAIATDIDFKGVFFKEGLPSGGGDLASSTVMFDDYVVPVLKGDTATFLSLKSDAKVKIVGFTDDHECVDEACKTLSLRRAQLVNAWLLAPEGHGSSEPVDTNATADGRQRNRRAEFQVISSPGQP
jgi:OOP family OmpA-OmpF porin